MPEPLATTGSLFSQLISDEEGNHGQDTDSHDEVAVMTKKKMRSLMMMLMMLLMLLLLLLMMRVNDD